MKGNYMDCNCWLEGMGTNPYCPACYDLDELVEGNPNQTDNDGDVCKISGRRDGACCDGH